MVNTYFACTNCKVYIDAGYRWASWSLGIVKRGKPVLVESVLSAADYRTPAKTGSARWLYREVLPPVRRFLEEHKPHRIVFGNTADFLLPDGDGVLEWMQEGFLPLLLPRYFVERLGFTSWDQVASFMSRQDNTPWWWLLEWDGLHEKARQKFQELGESTAGCKKSVRCNPASH